MEVFFLVKPDPGYDSSLDSIHVSVQESSQLLDHSSSGNLYVSCIRNIFLLCTWVPESVSCHCLSCWNNRSNRIPGTLHLQHQKDSGNRRKKTWRSSEITLCMTLKNNRSSWNDQIERSRGLNIQSHGLYDVVQDSQMLYSALVHIYGAEGVLCEYFVKL